MNVNSLIIYLSIFNRNKTMQIIYILYVIYGHIDTLLGQTHRERERERERERNPLTHSCPGAPNCGGLEMTY